MELKDTMINILKEYSYHPKDKGIDAILNKWKDNKASLIKLFSKDPNWIPEKYMCVKEIEITRNIDEGSVHDFFAYINRSLRSIWSLYTEEEKKNAFNCGLCIPESYIKWADYAQKYHSQFVDDEFAEISNKINPDLRIAKGQKTSRAVNKVLTFLKINRQNDYEMEFAVYSNTINPATFKRKIVLSLNPIDYLTMSFGNSWSSCQTIDKENKRRSDNSYHGMCSSGTMSYMLDGTSFVMYITSDANDKDYELHDKIERQMYHFSHESLIQGRLYPQSNDSGSQSIYTQYRRFVQTFMANLLNNPNEWKESQGESICDVHTDTSGTHYADYVQFSCCWYSCFKGSDDWDQEYQIPIGHAPICIECGHEHEDKEWITCCHNGKYTRCSCCGDRWATSSLTEYEGELYCANCMVTTVEGTRVPREKAVLVNRYYHDPTYLENMCEPCNRCGELIDVAEMVYDIETCTWSCMSCERGDSNV